MNVTTLSVSGALPGILNFTLERSGEKVQDEVQVGRTMKEISDDLSLLIDELLSPRLRRELRQWVLDSPVPGVLAILSTDSSLEAIRWEHLPRLLQLTDIVVVRCLGAAEHFSDETLQDQPRLLATGWSGRPRLDLPGIQEELTALTHIGTETGLQVRVLSEPSLTEFANTYTSFEPLLLHLIPPWIVNHGAMPEIVVSGGEDVEFVSMDTFLSTLPDNLRPRLVVINTCSSGEADGGPSAIRLVAEKFRTVAIGWLGMIYDTAAVDFARFFYTRLLEGRTVIEALRAYHSVQPTQQNLELATRALRPMGPVYKETVPVVWTSSLAMLDEPLLNLQEQQEEPMEEWPPFVSKSILPAPRLPAPDFSVNRDRSVEVMTFQARLAVNFEPQPWLNPALLKNGRQAITRLVLTSDQVLHNVGLAITCDTGSGTSIVRQTLSVERGPQPVPVDSLQFPVLYELISANVPRRQINFTVSCSLAGGVVAEMTRSVLWMGRAEWLDKPDTWHYIPAFVDPYADGVLDVIDNADRVLKQIVGPTSHFSAYQQRDGNFVMKQVEATFNCLRDRGLSYISPPPIAVFTPDDQDDHLASGQRVRTPDEIIERKRGTCHDLAILLAGCMEGVGIYPLIILIHGHTFAGFWKDADTHEDFWRGVRNNILRPSQRHGRGWTISDLSVLQDLVRQDAVVLVEATKVTDRNAQFLEAVSVGQENLSKARFDVAIDIQASRRFVQPL